MTSRRSFPFVFSMVFTAFLLTAMAVMAAPAFADTYFIWDDYSGYGDSTTYYDADKSGTSEDSQLCWAAATSNILTYTGWGLASGYSDASSIFSYFQSYWTNAGGNVYVGVDWWFDGENLTQGLAGWSQVTDTSGGGFFLDENVSDYVLWSSVDSEALTNIYNWLADGYALTLALSTEGGGHAVTVWGYDYDESGNVTAIYITDSDNDDGADLSSYTISYLNGRYYLSGIYSSWYISEVYGLSIMETVPEPATLLLFGVGLTGFSTLRRRKRKSKAITMI